MSYRTIMVDLPPGTPNPDLLRLAASFAERFDASVIGIAGRRQIQLAGAYGRSRLKETVFGGVTRDRLLHPTRCHLLAH